MRKKTFDLTLENGNELLKKLRKIYFSSDSYKYWNISTSDSGSSTCFLRRDVSDLLEDKDLLSRIFNHSIRGGKYLSCCYSVAINKVKSFYKENGNIDLKERQITNLYNGWAIALENNVGETKIEISPIDPENPHRQLFDKSIFKDYRIKKILMKNLNDINVLGFKPVEETNIIPEISTSIDDIPEVQINSCDNEKMNKFVEMSQDLDRFIKNDSLVSSITFDICNVTVRDRVNSDIVICQRLLKSAEEKKLELQKELANVDKRIAWAKKYLEFLNCNKL